jgi:predicted RNA-binding Zn-ribbon protein involved in translation (DUF1610 family)
MVNSMAMIELKDITGVEFRCRQCGHASIRRLDEVLRVPASCGNCDSKWQGNEGHEGQELLRFLHEITSYSAKDRPYSLRFHVEGLAQLLK